MTARITSDILQGNPADYLHTFADIDADGDMYISRSESAADVDAYDVNTDDQVEFWEPWQKINDDQEKKGKGPLFEKETIDIYRKAYQLLKSIQLDNLPEATKYQFIARMLASGMKPDTLVYYDRYATEHCLLKFGRHCLIDSIDAGLSYFSGWDLHIDASAAEKGVLAYASFNFASYQFIEFGLSLSLAYLDHFIMTNSAFGAAPSADIHYTNASHFQGTAGPSVIVNVIPAGLKFYLNVEAGPELVTGGDIILKRQNSKRLVEERKIAERETMVRGLVRGRAGLKAQLRGLSRNLFFDLGAGQSFSLSKSADGDLIQQNDRVILPSLETFLGLSYSFQ